MSPAISAVKVRIPVLTDPISRLFNTPVDVGLFVIGVEAEDSSPDYLMLVNQCKIHSIAFFFSYGTGMQEIPTACKV